jgi:hypothetical protein
MAEPTPQTFRLAVGQTKVVPFQLDVFDAAAATWDMRFRLRRRGGAVLVEKESGAGITYTGGLASASWDVTIDRADTYTDAVGSTPAVVLVKPGQYDWSLWDVDAGAENPAAYGTCTVYRTAETG